MFTRTGGWVLPRVLAWWLIVGVPVVPAGARYGGGQGTAAQPYLIATAAHLTAVGDTPGDWDKCFQLTANLDLRDVTQLNRIGTAQDGAFTGVFDGNYKTISNLRLVSGGSYLGLFGIVDAVAARILNLALLDPDVADDSGRYVAALVGLMSNGTVTNCHVRGGHVRGASIVGGLVGENMDGTITDCTAAATVYGDSRVGGLVGLNLFGTVTRCQAAGEVRGDASSWTLGGLVGENQGGTVGGGRASCLVLGGDRVGGLIGENIDGLADCCHAEGAVSGTSNAGGLVGKNRAGTTTDCYALAAVTAVTYAGGLVGCNGPSCDCTVYHSSHIVRCYAAGLVTGTKTGGLVALNDRSSVEDSFWDLQASSRSTSDGGVGQTAAQMSSLATYTGAGWDFAGEKADGTKDLWCLPRPGGYPRLAWEPTTVDFNGDGRVDLRDYALLAKRWFQADTGFWSSGRYVAPDGVLDFDDLINLADLWLAHRW